MSEDLKIIAEFIKAYKRLYRANGITKEEYYQYLQILENIESYDQEELRKLLM